MDSDTFNVEPLPTHKTTWVQEEEMMVEQDLAEDFLDKSFLLYLSDVPIKSGACPVDIVHSRLYHLFICMLTKVILAGKGIVPADKKP